MGSCVDPTLVSYNDKCQALLPHDYHLSTLIVCDTHEACQSGVATTVAKICRKYWIIKAHRIAKVIEQQCTCQKLEAKVETQLMAALLPSCLQLCTLPFLYLTMDYFGPINVKVGRNKTTKHYGVVFTCMNTTAIHCELTTDASTIELWQIFRFFSYHSYPKLLLLDNGTQMIGADNELKHMIDGWDKRKLKEFCADHGMKWQFIMPLAPHQNGCPEAMAKSVKTALKKAIGVAVLTPFELYTCLLEILCIFVC